MAAKLKFGQKSALMHFRELIFSAWGRILQNFFSENVQFYISNEIFIADFKIFAPKIIKIDKKW